MTAGTRTGVDMKGTITTCLAELVETKFGADRWTAVLDLAGIEAKMRPQLKMAIADIPDFAVVALLDATASVLGISAEQAADAFGEYWCCTYAQATYKAVVARWSNARDTILSLDMLHVRMTQTVPNARPPRFEYQWHDENTLDVTYRSHRHLLGVYMGLARGVGKLFAEPLKVFPLDWDRVRIVFS
jgi:Haem-NO-binding